MLADGEVIDIGGKRIRYIDTPHVPHGWDAGVIFEETTRTLFAGDLFAHYGHGPALTRSRDRRRGDRGSDDINGATALGPTTAPTIRTSRRRSRQTRSPSCTAPPSSGDGATQLHGLADVYERALRAAMRCRMTALQHHPRRSVRLDTLVRLRWLAIFGQIAALLVVTDGLDFQLPFWSCLAVIARLRGFQFVRCARAFAATSGSRPNARPGCSPSTSPNSPSCSYLTGGLENPFAFLFLGPVLISATALPPRMTMILAAFAVSCATLLVFVHYPLPWSSDDPLELPPIYMFGVWLSILLAIGYISIYAWQITEEARQLADALAATELVLAREQHLSQLDGLAAAAAHELGTPLATISLVSQGTGARARRPRRMRTTPASCASRRSAAARSWASSPRCRRRASRSST